MIQWLDISRLLVEYNGGVAQSPRVDVSARLHNSDEPQLEVA